MLVGNMAILMALAAYLGTMHTFLPISGDGQGSEGGDPSHRGGGGGDELQEADGRSVGEGPGQVQDDLGQALPHGGPLHRPPLQADLRAQRGRLQEDPLL